jgi:hypothetical protein
MVLWLFTGIATVFCRVDNTVSDLALLRFNDPPLDCSTTWFRIVFNTVRIALTTVTTITPCRAPPYVTEPNE